MLGRHGKTPKTSAERVRAYRERQKAAKNAANRQHVDDISVLGEPSQQVINTATATASQECAGRSRTYRNFVEPVCTPGSSTSVQFNNATSPLPSTHHNPRTNINRIPTSTVNDNANDIQNEHSSVQYSEYRRHEQAHREFKVKFLDNSFGSICSVCDRLWFKNDLKPPCAEHQEILNEIVPNRAMDDIMLCNTCMASLNKQTIYHNQDDSVNIVTPNMEMTARQSQSYSSTVTPVGDVCIAECQTLNGKTIVIAAIYISPNQNLDDIIYFIHRSLLVYSHAGANALGRGEDKIPLILGGDFNVNFGSNDSLPLIQFLRETFGLQINNNPKESTTKSGTTLDAIFTRYLENIESRTYISYFSYHKPIISVLPIEPPTDDSIMHI